MAYYRKDLIPKLTDKELDKLIAHCEYFKRDDERSIKRYNEQLKACKEEKRRRERLNPDKVVFS